jgi:hypothetical protein
LQAQVDRLLFEVGDLLVEGVDVGGGAQAGLAPGVLAQCGGETLFEMLDASVKPGGAFVGGEEVGLQRGSGDLWVPNWSSRPVTCDIAGRWPSGMIACRGNAAAVSDLPTARGLTGTAEP